MKPDNDKSQTTAPWRVKPIQLGKEDRYFEVVSGRKTIVQTHAREVATEGAWLAEDEANVRLIAASPEMAKALADLIHTFHARPDILALCGFHEHAQIKAACDALNKAGVQKL